MIYKLSWDKLFSSMRERTSNSNVGHRNEFDKDYDRIVYSSSLRRLQDKAQVFPLQENDFTRTRLTHSIEASAIARSLGISIEDWLIEKKEISEQDRRKLTALLQVCAIIHDLGNPPFGHYGEDIIRNWFEKWFESGTYTDLDDSKKLNEQERMDFTHFEGNAQTLRIVTKLQLLNDQYGVNFTYATLATILKYPWASNNKKAMEEDIKKFGYFSSEESIVKKIQEATGLEDGIRHPATFLLEAADDIAYLCADIEDAVKKRIIPWDREYNTIKEKLLKNDEKTYEYIFKYVDDKNAQNIHNEMPEIEIASIQNFKVMAQGLMINKAIEAFKNNYGAIMNGEFEHKSLLDNCNLELLIEELNRLAIEYCYVNKEVLTLELVGDTVINGLLDIFVNDLVKCDKEPKAKKRAGKLYSLISSNFKYVCNFDYQKEKKKNFTDIRLYDKLLLITDFVSGMTDSYAVNLYKELLGVKLP